MVLDLAKIGFSTEPYEVSYSWRDVVLYALGIGAKQDELDYLYEGCGPKVFPTFAMALSLPSLAAALKLTKGPFKAILHGAETIRMHKNIPPEGRAVSVSTLDAIYDAKKMAIAKVTTQTRVDGQLIFEAGADVIYRGEGGFGGALPPKLDIPTIPDNGKPTWVHEERIGQEQALLYRLSGDTNPLHVDPKVAEAAGFPEPILHGLCTYGYLCRAVSERACNSDAYRINALGAQFRKPVWPGQLLTTKAWDLGNGNWALRAFTDDEKPVITNAWANVVARGISGSSAAVS